MKIDETKEKKAIKYICAASKKYDYSVPGQCEKAINDLLLFECYPEAMFSRKYMKRLEDIGKGVKTGTCLLCDKRPAADGVTCDTCVANVIPDIELQRTPEKKAAEPKVQAKDDRKHGAGKAEKLPMHEDFADELVKGLSSSFDKVANQKTVRRLYNQNTMIMFISGINLIINIFLALYIFGWLGSH